MTMASTKELAANRRDIRPGRIITWTLLLIGGLIMITPLLFMFSTSLKTSGQVYDLRLIRLRRRSTTISRCSVTAASCSGSSTRP